VFEAVPDTANVDRHHAVEDSVVGVGRFRRRHHDAGVVESRVEPAVRRDGGGNNGGDLRFVADVPDQREHVTPLARQLVGDHPDAVSSMSTSTLDAPALANARAAASPIPELAPVTSATCPLKSKSTVMILLLPCCAWSIGVIDRSNSQRGAG
jgi:hypothetical protein